jgi:hypothetical protein
MNPIEHVTKAMQQLRQIAEAVEGDHHAFADAVAAEREVKASLLAQLARVLEVAFETLDRDSNIVLHVRGGDVLSYALVNPDTGSYGWIIKRQGCEEHAHELQLVDERWPVEAIFARAHAILMGSYEGLKLERIIEIRAVSAVLNGVCGAWKRGGLVK